MGNDKQLRDYADGFDVEKLQSAVDWLSARGLCGTVYQEKKIKGETVRLNLDSDGRFYGWVICVKKKPEKKCLINGVAGYVHSYDKSGYCFTTPIKG